MDSQMMDSRLGDMLPPNDGTGGLEDDHPNADMYGYRDGYLKEKGLERFTAHSEPGCDVRPMYDEQTVYNGYGDIKHGFQERKRKDTR
jgi:hypothetical protein